MASNDGWEDVPVPVHDGWEDVPVTAPKAPPVTLGPWSTVAVHFVRHLASGLGDKILAAEGAVSDKLHDKSGKVRLGDAYNRNLGFNDQLMEASDKENPNAKLVGNVAGVAGNMVGLGLAGRLLGGAGETVVNAPRAARLLSAAKEGSKVGAVLGGTNGFGDSRSDSALGTAADTAVGTAAGAATGAILPYALAGAGAALGPLARGGAKLLDKVARTKALKAGGVMLKDLRALQHKGLIDPTLDENQLGEFILNNGLKFGDAEHNVADRFGELAEDRGETIGAVTRKLDELVRAQPRPVGATQLPLEQFPEGPAAEYAQGSASVPQAPRSYTELNAPQTPPGPAYGQPNIQGARASLSNPEAAQASADALMADPKVAKQYFVRPSALANRMEDELLTPLRGRIGHGGLAEQLQPWVDDVRALGQKPLRPTLASGELGPQHQDAVSFGEMQAQKKAIDEFLNHDKEQTPFKEQLKRLRGILNSEIEQKAEALSSKLDPGLYDAFAQAKSDYGMASTVREIAADRALRHTANRNFSPSDYGTGVAALLAHSTTHGGVSPGSVVLGLGTALGHHLVRERGSSAAAVTARALANALRSSPGPILSQMGTAAAAPVASEETIPHIHIPTPMLADQRRREEAARIQALARALRDQHPTASSLEPLP
jgi:hypothetical protein